MDNKKYAVGYGKPPREHQFVRGRSGNPKGRPKHRTSLIADLRKVLSETIVVTERGRTKRITIQMAIAKSLVASAIKGNERAVRAIINLSGEDHVASDLERFEREARKELQVQSAISRVLEVLNEPDQDDSIHDPRQT